MLVEKYLFDEEYNTKRSIMTIMSALIMYVVPALLGRTYDLKNETVGPDIFMKDEVAKARKIDRYITTSEYKLVSELSEATDFLDVSGKLALKLKSGNIDIQGAGKYLKESTNFQNKIDLLIKVHYETVAFTLPSDIKPIPNWQDNLKGIEATHYIRTITYGGDLIASVRFTTANEADKMIIKGEIQGQLNTTSSSFGLALRGNLENIKNKIGDSASMNINYYATVPLNNISVSIDGLIDLVEQFPEQTKSINNGYGVPLNMEIFSLEGLQKNITTFWQTHALTDQMYILNEQLSDIRNTKLRLANWMKTVPPILSPEENQKIGLFQTKLDAIDKIFSETIANLNLSVEAGGEQFKPAFTAYYNESDSAIPNLWVKKLSKLKAEVLSSTPSFEADFGGAQFNYWGSDSCPSESKLLYSGMMSTTGSEKVGASDYTCIPKDQDYPVTPKDQSIDDVQDFPQILPIVFISRKKGQSKTEKVVKCASCRVPGKSSQTMLSGQSECPKDWVKQYEGVLISTDFQQVRGDTACLDISKEFSTKPSSLTDATILTEVSPKCGNFPCSGGLSENSSIPCVVCSRTRKSDSISEILRL